MHECVFVPGPTVLAVDHLLLTGILDVSRAVDNELWCGAVIVQQALLAVVALHLHWPD